MISVWITIIVLLLVNLFFLYQLYAHGKVLDEIAKALNMQRIFNETVVGSFIAINEHKKETPTTD